MTREELEMLTGATEVIDALRDQLRFTRESRPAPDFEAERRLGDISVDLHSLISKVTHDGLPNA